MPTLPTAMRRDDAGSAVVEFVTLGVLMLVPLVYLVMTLGRAQAGSFAVDAAAREGARSFTSAPDEQTGRARMTEAIRLALRDQGFEVDPAKVTQVSCAQNPCLTPGALVTVQITLDVVLPGVPRFVDSALSTHLTVRSSQTAAVDAFRPAPKPIP